MGTIFCAYGCGREIEYRGPGHYGCDECRKAHHAMTTGRPAEGTSTVQEVRK